MMNPPMLVLGLHNGFYHTTSLIQTIRLVPEEATNIRIGFATGRTTIYADHDGVELRLHATPTRAWGHVLVPFSLSDLDRLYAQLLRPATPAVALHVRPNKVVIAGTQQRSPQYEVAL